MTAPAFCPFPLSPLRERERENERERERETAETETAETETADRQTAETEAAGGRERAHQSCFSNRLTRLLLLGPITRCVVHYQLPASVDIYVHRSGRTARAGADGLAVSLIVPKERGRFLALQKALDRDPPPEFPVDAQLMPGIRERVKLAVRLDELERRQKKARNEMDWAERTARELEIDLDEASDLGDDDQEADGGRKKKKKKVRGVLFSAANRAHADRTLSTVFL